MTETIIFVQQDESVNESRDGWSEWEGEQRDVQLTSVMFVQQMPTSRTLELIYKYKLQCPCLLFRFYCSELQSFTIYLRFRSIDGWPRKHCCQNECTCKFITGFGAYNFGNWQSCAHTRTHNDRRQFVLLFYWSLLFIYFYWRQIMHKQLNRLKVPFLFPTSFWHSAVVFLPETDFVVFVHGLGYERISSVKPSTRYTRYVSSNWHRRCACSLCAKFRGYSIYGLPWHLSK